MIEKIISRFSLRDIHIRQVLRSAGYNFFTKTLGVVLGFALSFILAREFGSAVVGVIALLHSLVGVALLVGSFGFPKAILRLVPEYRAKYGVNGMFYVYVKVFGYLLLFSMAAMLIFLLLKETINEHFFLHVSISMDTILTLTAVSIVAIAFMSYNLQSLRALYSDLWFNTLMVVPKLFNLLLIGGVVIFCHESANAVYAKLATDFFGAILSAVFIIIIFKKLSVHYVPISVSFVKVWELAWPMFLTGGLFMVMNQTDTLMLGYMKQAEDVGIYHIASRIASATLFVLMAMGYRSAPLYAELYHAGRHEELKHLAQRTAKLMFWMTLPIVVVLLIGGNFVLGLFGDEFLAGYYALLFIVIAEFIHTISGSVGNFLNMTGHQKVFRNIILIGVSVNILLNVLLIPTYSYSGAAFASLISLITWNIIGTVYIQNKFGYFIGYIPQFNLRKLV
jgi:O-antigen/teichoic acid export membrane protein